MNEEMDFNKMCWDAFSTAHEIKGLEDDINDYNKAVLYLNHFTETDRKEIVDFIVDVRLRNPIDTIICQLLRAELTNGTAKPLINLQPYELYNELNAEIPKLIKKTVHDLIKIKSGMDEQESMTLANRIVQGDISIFSQYEVQANTLWK